MTEADELRSFIAQTVPFLEEAWTACFRGQKERLLSAEERGMGQLLAKFRTIAAKKPALPPGVITEKESTKREETAITWAHRLLGNPNKLKPELREWMGIGETCADGLRKANAEVHRLRGFLYQMCERHGYDPSQFETQDLAGGCTGNGRVQEESTK